MSITPRSRSRANETSGRASQPPMSRRHLATASCIAAWPRFMSLSRSAPRQRSWPSKRAPTARARRLSRPTETSSSRPASTAMTTQRGTSASLATSDCRNLRPMRSRRNAAPTRWSSIAEGCVERLTCRSSGSIGFLPHVPPGDPESLIDDSDHGIRAATGGYPSGKSEIRKEARATGSGPRSEIRTSGRKRLRTVPKASRPTRPGFRGRRARPSRSGRRRPRSG